MAKRELIDKNELLLNWEESMFLKDLTVEEKAEILTKLLDSAYVYTEQEIIKPYLEKFNTLIREHHMNDLADDEMSNFERDILNLIDNLLSEQEGEE